MADHWEVAPRHMMRLDIRSLLQDAAIEEVSVHPWLKCSLKPTEKLNEQCKSTYTPFVAIH
jgi:YLP motif-containing protein 1